MIQIEDPPDRPICAQHGPLRWGWFPVTKQGPRWVSFYTGDGGVLVPHLCLAYEPVPIRWQPDPVIAERAHRHMDEIRAELGWGPNPLLDGKTKELTEEK